MQSTQPTNLSANQGKCLSAIIRENLRKYWPISLVALLILLLSTLFPIMVAYSSESRLDYVLSIVRFTNPGYIILSFLLPILTSVIVFRYNCSSGNATVIHSLPINRKTLFIGNYISGMILAFAPMLLSAIAMLPYIKFTFESIPEAHLWSAQPSLTAWFFFILSIFVVQFFVFTISCIAGMISGNLPIHFILACVLNFIVFFVYAIIIGYLSSFLLGFEASSASAAIALHLHPLPVAIDTYTLHPLWLIIYFAISAVLTICAYLLYKHRKIERAGDSIVFRPVEHILTYLISLMGMAATGLLFFYANSEELMPFFIGLVFGAIIIFCIVSMVFQKTPKIFNLQNAKRFGIFVIIAIIFISSTVFDITGYSSRIPNASSVKSGEITFSSLPFNVPFSFYDATIEVSKENPEQIATMISLHNIALEGARLQRENEREGNYNYAPVEIESKKTSFNTNITFDYNTGSVFNLHRYFAFKGDERVLEAIFSFPEFRESKTIESSVGIENVTDIDVSSYYLDSKFDDRIYDSIELPITSSEREELLKLLDEEYMTLSYNDMIRKYEDILIEFDITYRNKKEIEKSKYRNDRYDSEIQKRSMSYAITDDYVKTVNWLKQKGIFDALSAKQDTIE